MHIFNFSSRFNIITGVVSAATLFLGVFAFFLIDYNMKYSVYFILFFVVASFYIMSESQVLKVSSVLFLLVFVENILVYNRYFLDVFIVGISVVFALMLVFLSTRNIGRLGGIYFQGYCWLFFLILSFLTIFLTDGLTLDLFYEQLIIFQMKYVEFFLFFLVGYLAFDEIEDVDKFLKVIILFCCLVAITHIFSLITGYNIEGIRGAEAVTQERDLADEKNWRYGGVFGNPNYMAAFYTMVAPVCLIVFINERKYLYKILSALAVCLLFLSVSTTGSRGGVVFVVTNILLLLAYYKASVANKTKYLLCLLIFLIFSYFMVEIFFSEFLYRSLERISQIDVAQDVRWDMWLSTLQMIFQNPFGIGLLPESFGFRLYNDIGVYLGHPHNAYLYLIVSNGLIGFLLFARIVYVQLKKTFQNTREYSGEKLVYINYCIIALILGFMLSGLVNGAFINNYKLNHVFALFLGLSAFVNHKYGERDV